MTETYYLDGKAYTFDTQEELDAWLAENPTASLTNDKVSFKPSTDFNTVPADAINVGPTAPVTLGQRIKSKISEYDDYNKNLLTDPSLIEVEETDVDVDIDLEKRKEKQKAELNKELDKAFLENPTLFGQIIENSENLSLQDREIDAGMFGSPQDYLYDIIKKEIGGFGLFGGDRKTPGGFRSRKTGEIIGTSGPVYYPDLTNADIEAIVEERFQLQLQDEKLNKYNTRALNKVNQIELSENGDVRVWQNKNRRNIINYTFEGTDFQIASAIEIINNGVDINGNTATEEEIKTAYTTLETLKEETGATMLYNLKTGSLSIARNKKEEDDKIANGEGDVVSLNLAEQQRILNSQLKLIEPENQYDYLKNLFETSSLVLADFNEELDIVRSWSVKKTGYQVAAEDGKEGVRTIVRKSLRDIMFDTELVDSSPYLVSEGADLRHIEDFDEWEKAYKKDKSMLIEKSRRLLKAYKQDHVEYTRENEALKRMYLLNEGLEDVVRPEHINLGLVGIPTNLSALEGDIKNLLGVWTSDYYTSNLVGSTEREIQDGIATVYDNLGIEITKSEADAMEKTWSESVNNALLPMNKMLVEFGSINKFASVYGVEAAFGRVIAGLNRGKYVKNGITYTEAAVASRAAAKFPKLKPAAALSKYADDFGLIAQPSLQNKFYQTMLFGGYEGVKFELFTQFDASKLELKPEFLETSGFSTGFGFGAGGRLITPLAPFLQKQGLLKDLNYKKIGLNSKKLFETFVTQPSSFVVGSEFGEITNFLVKDIFGISEIENFMHHHYGDYDAIEQRLIGSYFTGLGLGVGHLKGFGDFKSKNALQRQKVKALRLIQQEAKQIIVPEQNVKLGKGVVETSPSSKTNRLTEEQINNFTSKQTQDLIHKHASKKQLENIYKHWEIFDMATSRLNNVYRAEGYLDPRTATERVKEDHKELIEREKEAGNEIILEVVNNNRLKFRQKGIDPTKNAEITKQGKKTTIRYNAERYTPDHMVHEVHHHYTEDLLGKDAVFKAEFMRNISNITNKVILNRLVTEKEAKILGNPARQGQNMTLTESIKIEYPGGNYGSNNVRIQQWELFGHIAERMGNKADYEAMKNTTLFEDFKQLIEKIPVRGKRKVGLQTEQQVFEWFKNYAEHVKKGKNVIPLFEQLKTVIDPAATKIRAEQRRQEGKTSENTYSSKELDLDSGVKLNNPKKIADNVQSLFEKAMAEGKTRKQFLKEISDPSRRSDNYDANYPILGDKLGPMLDIALSNWNKTQAPDFKINLGDRAYESKRSSIALDFLTSKSRGLENFFEKYEATNKNTGQAQPLMSWVTGQMRLRMQETIERGVGKETDVREVNVGDWNTFDAMFAETPSGGKVDQSLNSTNPNVKPKGIQLKNYEFNFGNVKRKINPESVENIKEASKEVFYKSKVEENTGMQIGEKLRSTTDAEMNVMIGVKEGMKPGQIDAAQSKFFRENKEIAYDAGIELTSNPRFYENTNAAKTVFNFAHTKTSEKYKTAELTVEEAKRTNARAFKYKKKKATPELVDKVQEVINSGRDAGTRVKKQNVLKSTLGKNLGNQLYRETLVELKQEIDFKLKEEGADVKYWSGQKAKLEAINAGLAMRRLRGAVPEKLASKQMDIVIEEFISDIKRIDFAKELVPGFHVRNLIENNKKYSELVDTMGGVDNFLKEMGYELKGIDLKTFQTYAESQRLLGTLKLKVVEPKIFKNWSDTRLIKEIESVFKNKGLKDQLKIGEEAWYKDYNNVKEFDTLVDWLKENLEPELFNSQIIKKSIGIGLGKVKFATDYNGNFSQRNNPYWENLIKDIGKSKKKLPRWTREYKTVDNGTFKENVNKELENRDLSTDKKKLAFANYITKKYLTREGVSYENTIKANEKMLEHVYGKLFDYYAGSKNKATALNNIFRLLQMQTSIGNGFTRSLATHNAITTRYVKNWSELTRFEKTHSEHEFQAFGFNANFMLNMIKNSSSKAEFLRNFKPLAKIFKQSIIDRSVQEKYDGKEFGGKTGFDFKFTTEAGKYPWLRELAIAETTLDLVTGKTYDKLLMDVNTGGKLIKILDAKLKKRGIDTKNKSFTEKVIDAKIHDLAIANGRKKKKTSQGLSAFDFDLTVGVSENFVFATKGGKKRKISSGEWPFVGEKLLEEGWKMDFTDFNKVTNGKPGPFFNKMKNQIKKFGPENVFILTARAPESQKAIHDWLKSEGIEIPIENVVGLGNSTGEAKAMWMLEKFSEGYNDMYFVDDALPNVKAVKDVLNQLDVKSKVQQALMSKNLDIDINNIMQHSLNIESQKKFSKAEAKIRGKDIKRRRIFMRDSAADLELLIEPLYGKGKKGNENKKWFKEELVLPFERGIKDYNAARQSAKNDYMSLRKENKDVVKMISKEVEGTSFTNDMAMRVYLWSKAGYTIPDLAKTSEAKLVEHVMNNPKLKAYAERFATITKQAKGLKEPGQNWWAETMAGEVTNIDRGVSRKEYLAEWIERKNEIFSEVNLNKMESKLGTRWRENIEDMFDRMETGRTRSLKLDRGSSAMMNYLNGGIGTIMNFNTRSAALQTISTLNFLNMRENNPIAAARAMGNVKQFAKDFMFIMNSDMLKQRRDGLSINVTEAEIASAAASSPNMIQGVIAKVLKAGYLPTKLADSFAISFGGATFYRNRIKMYEKQGMTTKEAEKNAFLDFQVLSERTQQSSRADLLSRQQTTLIGRFVLPFANTPMQMNRAGMKDILDIAKGRTTGLRNTSEAVGRISYYMGAQVALFAGLQSALFAMLFNDEDVSEEKIASTKTYTLQSTADSMLRGFGVQGAVISAFKNAIFEFFKQNAKPAFKADYSEVAEDLLNISPPIGSKFGLLDSAGDDMKWGKDTPFKFELGNPKLEASLKTIQATTNAPVYSPYQNVTNLQHALSDKYEMWQRGLMGAGWSPYNVGIEKEKKTKKKTKFQTNISDRIIID